MEEVAVDVVGGLQWWRLWGRRMWRRGDEVTDLEPGPCPRHITLQWHITERCNLRCAHCYQTDYQGKDMPLEDMELVLDQFRELLMSFTRRTGATHGHINITGGEPVLCQDLFSLILT